MSEFSKNLQGSKIKTSPTIRDEQQAKSSKNRQMEACFQMDVLVKISVAERDERSRRRSECLLFITNGTAPQISPEIYVPFKNSTAVSAIR